MGYFLLQRGIRMETYLVVANQTLGGAQLDRAVRERIARGASEFFVLVPATAPRHESADWDRGFSAAGLEGLPADLSGNLMEEDARRREAELEEARRRSTARLDQMVERIRAAGGRAEGRVGEADPAAAVRHVLQERSFDEVLVSTLPTRLSHWLRMDLPSRVARMTDAPVTTIEAQD
jgi:hypothetical protein